MWRLHSTAYNVHSDGVSQLLPACDVPAASGSSRRLVQGAGQPERSTEQASFSGAHIGTVLPHTLASLFLPLLRYVPLTFLDSLLSDVRVTGMARGIMYVH